MEEAAQAGGCSWLPDNGRLEDSYIVGVLIGRWRVYLKLLLFLLGTFLFRLLLFNEAIAFVNVRQS